MISFVSEPLLFPQNLLQLQRMNESSLDHLSVIDPSVRTIGSMPRFDH
jgi:hypothetical protein